MPLANVFLLLISIVKEQIFTQNIFYDPHETKKSDIIIINGDKDKLVSNERFKKIFYGN